MTGTIITKKGIQLLVKLMATKGELVFNRVGIGTGLLPTGYDPASMIDLVNYKMDGAISRCEADLDVAKITMQVSSIGVETGFTMTEIGIFAEDPDVGEILYSYLDLQEDPQYIYAEGGDAEKYIEITLEVAIEESTKVSAYINPDSLVTRKEFEKQLLNFKEEIKGGLEEIDFDDSGEVEGIESFTDFMSSFVKRTNISQFFSNLKAGLKYVLHAGQLVNSGMCETPGMFPLDAAFGKTLQDQITQLYSDLELDYTNTNPEVQDLHTFLQRTLLALFPKIVNLVTTLVSDWSVSGSGGTPYVSTGDGYIRFSSPSNWQSWGTFSYTYHHDINIGIGAKLSYSSKIYVPDGSSSANSGYNIQLAEDGGSYVTIDSYMAVGNQDKTSSQTIDLSEYAGKSVSIRVQLTKSTNYDSYVQFSKLAVEYT